MHDLPMQGVPDGPEELEFPLEADSCKGSRMLPSLGTDSISWEKGLGWDSNPSSTAQLAPSAEAAKGLVCYSSDVTDRVQLYVHRCCSCLLHPGVASRLEKHLHPEKVRLKQNALLASGSKSSLYIWGWISTMKCAHHTNKCGISRVFTGSLASSVSAGMLGCWRKCSRLWSLNRVSGTRGSQGCFVAERGRNTTAWCPWAT